jgi:polysaccharide export outer membrane protein
MKHLLLAVFSLLLAVTASHAQSGYRVKSGDTLAIEVLEDASLSRSVLVLPGGSFDFPFAGTIRASGRTTGQIEASIAQGIASNFANSPTVFVSVASLRPRVEPRDPPPPRTVSIYLLGEVNTPGIREVAPGTTFLQALAQAGGFTNFAAKKRVQLRRTNPKTGAQSVTIINYKALSRGAVQNLSIKLQKGDVIVIPERRLFE